ncbi:MAG TPA: hypothetical protein VFV17_03210, partial [Usitatibacteraceae bacterium]|nr:hypothetical protein [Usitatibacteraceae bacterium]
MGLLLLCWAAIAAADTAEKPLNITYAKAPSAPERQSVMDATRKSEGCNSCHTATDRHTMHQNPAVVLGCTDCHGGDAKVQRPKNSDYKGAGSDAYTQAMFRAHVNP